MARNEIEQFGRSHLDDVRKELDGKIENRVTEKMFFWVIGVLVVIATGIFSFTFIQIGKIDDRTEGISKRTTIIETQIEERRKK